MGFGTYFKALGCNLGAAPLPVVSQTGLHASPLIGSTGWVIAAPQASGATPQQLEAALVFILYMTGPQADLNLWNYAHDIPANIQAYDQAVSQLKAGQLTPSCLNDIMEAYSPRPSMVRSSPTYRPWPITGQHSTSTQLPTLLTRLLLKPLPRVWSSTCSSSWLSQAVRLGD